MDKGWSGRFSICDVVLCGCLFFLAVENAHAFNRTYPFRIVTILEPPFVMKDPETGRYSGFLIDVMRESGIPLDHVDTPMHDTYGWEEQPGMFTGAIGDLVDGKYDIAVAPFSIRSGRAKAITFSQPISYMGYLVLYKPPTGFIWTVKTNALGTLVKPFSPGLWCLITVVSFLVSIALVAIRRYSPYENGTMERNTFASLSWGSGLMYLIGTLTGRNTSAMLRSTSGRVLTVVWWIFSLMTVGAYVAGLVVILFRFNPHLDTVPFSSLDEMLSESDVKVLGVKNSATYRYMASHSGHFERLLHDYWKRNWDTVMMDSLQDALDMIEGGNGKYAVVLDEALATYLAGQEPCNKMLVGEPIGDDTFGFACRKGTTICEEINHHILKLQESGQMEKLIDRWFWSSCHMTSQTYATESSFLNALGKEPGLLSQHSITIHRFSAAFLVLLLGFILAMLVLVCEVVHARRKGNVHLRLKASSRNEDAQGIQEQDFTLQRDL